MNEEFLQECQNFFALSKILQDENLDEKEKMDNLHRLLQIFLRLEEFEKNNKTLPVITKLYFAEVELHNHFENQKKFLKNFFDEIESQKNYRNRQVQLREKGKIERKKRTHQLILIGETWQNFCEKNRLTEKNNANDLDKLLKNFSRVAHRRFPITKKYLPQKKYKGNDKDVIHNFCLVGGTWESFFRKNFCFKKICARCLKKIACKKLDEKYFAYFLRFYQPRILTLLSK